MNARRTAVAWGIAIVALLPLQEVRAQRGGSPSDAGRIEQRVPAQGQEAVEEPEPPAPAPTPPPAAAPGSALPAEPSDEQQLAMLVADLTRYAALQDAELRREIAVMTQTLGRQRSDAARIRLAVLYTMARNREDDQRALQLLEGVVKGNPGTAGMKQLASVLHAQVAERVRQVRDEQAKANDALQKLEALRAMERSLLRDRVRGGGGAAGAGSGGG